MKILTEKEAYAAMYHFLDRVYQRSKSDALGDLLGDMSLLIDGKPADPAVENEWHESVMYAVNGGEAGKLTFQ